MKKIISLIILALFLFSFTSAITFEKKVETNVVVPQFNQPAEILLRISDIPVGKYNIYTLTDVNLLPVESFNVQEKEIEMEVQIFPMQSLSARGFYTFVYYLRDFNGVNHEDRMTVKVVDLKDLIEISSEANYPGKEMTFFVRNRDNARLENLIVEFNSVFFGVEKKFNLEPFEKKEFRVAVDPEKIKKIPTGNYLLEGKFNVDRGDGVVKGKIYFGESKEIDTKEEKEGFFIRTETISKTNGGNTIETVKIEVSRHLLTSFFTFFSEKPEGVERSGLKMNYHWLKRIGPSDSVEIKARTNYLVPFIILIVLVGTLLTFKRYNRAKLEIKKSVSHVRTKGGEFALRVRVHIKAHRSLDNVLITEKIPAIVKVHESFGAMKPSSINLSERRLQWNFGNIQSGEERIFSYVVYSKVGVVGKFALPRSVAVFEENGNILETFSNEVFFLSEQVKKV